MPFALRSIAALSFVTALAVLSAPGCSQQGEGERCDLEKNGDADCNDGLTCIKATDLHDGITDRCCPAEGTESDTRCTRATIMASGGSSSGGTSSSGAGAAGEANGGAAGALGAVGGAAGETNGGAGTPATTDGGMSGAGGAPVTTDAGAAGASTAGQGGAG
ncbi:MAG: hypothetical protein ABUL60_06675 [Myxococcales bacterium]